MNKYNTFCGFFTKNAPESTYWCLSLKKKSWRRIPQIPYACLCTLLAVSTQLHMPMPCGITPPGYTPLVCGTCTRPSVSSLITNFASTDKVIRIVACDKTHHWLHRVPQRTSGAREEFLEYILPHNCDYDFRWNILTFLEPDLSQISGQSTAWSGRSW